MLVNDPNGKPLSVVGSPAGGHSPLFGGVLNNTSFEFLFAGRVLEIGAGLERVCADSTTVDINQATHPDYVADAKDLPFGNKEFDLVIMHEVLCTMSREDQLAVMKEAKRVARAVYVRAWKLCAWRVFANCGLKITQEEVDAL